MLAALALATLTNGPFYEFHRYIWSVDRGGLFLAGVEARNDRAGDRLFDVCTYNARAAKAKLLRRVTLPKGIQPNDLAFDGQDILIASDGGLFQVRPDSRSAVLLAKGHYDQAYVTRRSGLYLLASRNNLYWWKQGRITPISNLEDDYSNRPILESPSGDIVLPTSRESFPLEGQKASLVPAAPWPIQTVYDATSDTDGQGRYVYVKTAYGPGNTVFVASSQKIQLRKWGQATYRDLKIPFALRIRRVQCSDDGWIWIQDSGAAPELKTRIARWRIPGIRG